MILYRPVGEKELELIIQSNNRKFPPGLPEQPFFYPVLTRKYAIEIAERWNTKDVFSGKKGFVTKFEIDDDYISHFQVHQVGDNYHLEYWIPADELSNFNNHIVGLIQIVETFM